VHPFLNNKQKFKFASIKQIKMKTPFTSQQFIETIRNYNESVFPMQVIFYLIALILIYLIVKPVSHSGKIISTIFAFFWLWMGIAYHLVFFTAINKAAYVFGSLFIVQSMLFIIPGVLQNKLSFKMHADVFGITGTVLIIYALFIYPVLGYIAGHAYPFSPTFGLPCPTTIFTFGCLLLCDKKCPSYVLIIPFLWSVIGFAASFNFGIWEEVGLLIAGLLALPMLLIRNRRMAVHV
jgi:hypothetical protein